MSTRMIHAKVAGVTFEGRQLIIAEMSAGDEYQLRPEPENKFDPNAIAVWVAREKGALQIGYIPKELAATIAPLMEGETFNGKVFEITGGFEKWDGSRATLGVVLQIEIPDDEWLG